MLRTVSAVAGATFLATLGLLGCSQAPAHTAGTKTRCTDASLALDDDTIVGTFQGRPLTYKDLGPELRKAEEKALRQYCDAVSSVRRIAFENHVTETLVSAEAKKAGIDNDTWVRQEVEKRVPEPTDAEVQAFYDKQKAAMGDKLPPLDMIRPQVVSFLKRDKSEAAVDELIRSLIKGAAVERKLPDVRSPPLPLDNAPHTPSKGKIGAKVRLVEFADFQCPYCSRAADTVKELVEKYGDRVEFSYRHFPLRSIHPQAQRASEIAQCAAEQGKFWQVHDGLYANQNALDEASAKKVAIDAGVDAAKLDECLSAGRGAAQVDIDFKKGEEIGVEGTPSFFINGRQYSGNPTAAAIGQALDEELGL